MSARPIRRVGIFYHPRLAEAKTKAEALTDQLMPMLEHVWLSRPWDSGSTDLLADTDLLICLGGDGTILRAARVLAPHRGLILGVDMGRQAFLTELTPDQIDDHLPALFKGDFDVEERTMLAATAIDASEDTPDLMPALNDVMVGRGSLGQPAYLYVRVNGDLIGVVRADAVVVASATGSTGYSLSAGGPILHPRARSVVLTPVAPHLAAAAPLVLPADVEIQLNLGREHAGALSVDGQRPFTLAPGGGVEVRRGDSLARLIRFGERSFFAELGDRLAWLEERRLRSAGRTGVEPFDREDVEPA